MHDSLWTAYSQDRSIENRNALVEQYMPMTRNVANKYSSDPQMFDDCLSVAIEELILAIERSKSQSSTYIYLRLNHGMKELCRAKKPKCEPLVDEHFSPEVWTSFEMNDLLSVLSPMEAVVLRERYLHSKTFNDIATEIGVDDKWIRNVHSKAISTLRSHYDLQV